MTIKVGSVLLSSKETQYRIFSFYTNNNWINCRLDNAILLVLEQNPEGIGILGIKAYSLSNNDIYDLQGSYEDWFTFTELERE